MRGSAAFRVSVAPGGGLAPSWVRDSLSRNAGASPSLDLRFADSKSLVDSSTGANLVTFTRASSGTYVGSDGLIKTATTNLLLRSEEIGTSPWATNSPGSVAYTANVIAAPTGAVTADRVTATADFAGPNQFISAVSGLNYAFSFYIKAVTPGALDAIRVECFSGRFAQFNITTRVFSSVNAAITPSFVSVGDGWVRVQLLFTAPSTGSLAVAVYANTSSDFYLWGAQLEQSSTVGDYIPTTSTINSSPRFDHNPTTGESLGLLVEEQRTNLLVRSEEFDNASWTLGSASITANASTAPNGTSTADQLIEVATTANHEASQSFTPVANTAYTLSCYFRAAGSTTCGLRYSAGLNGTGIICSVNLTAKTATVTSGVGTASITEIGAGWFRVSLTATASATPSSTFVYAFRALGTAGSTGNSIYLWGAQLEAGAFPTSYIPTTTATVTRSADVASITGANFSSWYNQTEGTVFVDGSTPAFGGTTGFVAINSGGSTNRLDIRQGRYLPTVTGASTAITWTSIVSGPTLVANTSYKQATAVSNANHGNSISGGLETSSTAIGTIAATQLIFGMRDGQTAPTGGSSSTIRRLTYWPSRLPNATLQQITR